ncbi:flagellar hook-associated protein FlgL [Cytobacillus sp. FJAT-54145]|uniref:Flagellar hook-associated protein FlgL n=1 Tax=Cytobacillus spartinae TaxID=3299023 RepID=A0ABW6KFQ3_9BACI
MRVTQNMLTRNNLNYISNNYVRYGELQDQLMSGKKITRPSQDPVIAMKGMRYRSQVVEVEQFKRNLNEVYNWMDNTDGALGETTSIFLRLKELTVQAANDTYNSDQRQSIAKEIKELEEHLQALANTKVNDKYIFNGTDINSKPVDISNIEKTVTDLGAGNPEEFIVTYQGKQFKYDTESTPGTFLFKNGNEQIEINATNGNVGYDSNISDTTPSTSLLQQDIIISAKNAISSNNQDFKVEVMKGVQMEVNIRPQNVFSAEMFKDISDLYKALENPDTKATDMTKFLDKIEDQLDKITSERSELGARLNRVELIENRIGQQEVTAKKTMSENEDIDMEKVIIELTTQESIHRAALAAGAKIIQPTLMDFLR